MILKLNYMLQKNLFGALLNYLLGHASNSCCVGLFQIKDLVQAQMLELLLCSQWRCEYINHIGY